MSGEIPRTYKVLQFAVDERGVKRNIGVSDLDSLVTHHPWKNRHAHMIDGAVAGAEPSAQRAHAYIDGEFQEIKLRRFRGYEGLQRDQVLLVKDFILEDEPASDGRRTRAVDVPAPVAGVISNRDDTNGVVDIADRSGGTLIARIRHLGPIAVDVGDSVSYGQTLGTQNARGMPKGTGKHVHIEMDTRYHAQFDNYIADLTSGRLPVQARFRTNVEPVPLFDNGAFRLGESHSRIRDLQQAMAAEGYRGTGGRPLDQDGVYRPGMQGALLDFQRAHGVPQTGNIDSATLRFAPHARQRETDRQDHVAPGRSIHVAPESLSVPGHRGHPDHRPEPPKPPEPAVNRPARQISSTGDGDLDRLAAALLAGDEASMSEACERIRQSAQVQALAQWGRDSVAAEQAAQRRQQETAAQHRAPAMSI